MIAAPSEVTSLPAALPETTTTVVIGSGFSGLAVASELSRRGVAAIVVDGLELVNSAAPSRCSGGPDAVTLSERVNILRLLQHYATSHSLDVRSSTKAVQLSLAAAGTSPVRQWVIETADGVLLADTIVLTKCAQNQLRKILSGLGMKAGRDLLAAMRAMGLYLVGVGDLIAPTTREILHQAKVVGQTISARSQTLALGPAKAPALTPALEAALV